MAKLDPDSVTITRAEPGDRLGDYTAWRLSEAGGLTQFGALIEELAPGSSSSDRHWHSDEDELLYMLSGEAVLVEDAGEAPLYPGDCCAWPKGVANGHRIENRSDAPCRYLVVGTRSPDDTVTYTTEDKILTKRNFVKTLTRKDGSPLG
ncbi:cupin domain-containing protein [Litorisediminicola beolgyonensis]|uniref:Cupin domain-containing protein n=1 Tax=Litorisediminicola beolgyonensis TaxID=1173614 RepID=A0ABW3ZKC4_9RHOB